jgi:hypothetical protein
VSEDLGPWGEDDPFGQPDDDAADASCDAEHDVAPWRRAFEHPVAVAIEVNPLRRRPPGQRMLVYLDQSTVSALATEERFGDLRDLLRGAVQEGRLVCPESLGHSGETLAAKRSWEDITKLTDELSMGISFRGDNELADYEVHAAAAAFCGHPAAERWEEAFDTDPHASLDELFPGGVRVSSYFPPSEPRLAEVTYSKDSEAKLEAIYEKVRRDRVSFEEQVEREFSEMVYWKLGPLIDPDRFAEQMARGSRGLMGEWVQDIVDIAPGSAYKVFMTVSERKAQAEHLIKRFPELRGREQEFAASSELRNMPSLRYPAIFRAALATMRGRRPKRGDGYDIEHLTKGLSRCDIVTADAGMTQLAMDRRLVPSQCELLRFNDINGLTAAVERAIG